MNPNATISISLILSIISCLGVLVSITSTLKRNNESEQNRQIEIEKNFVKINVKLDDFCDDTKTILKNQEHSNNEIRALSEKLIKEDERIETLFRYKSNHEGRIQNLEEKIIQNG